MMWVYLVVSGLLSSNVLSIFISYFIRQHFFFGIVLIIDLQSHINTCEFLKIPCVHPECGMLMKRSDFTSHLENECMFRLEKCTFCQKQMVLPRIKVNHFEHQRTKITLSSLPNSPRDQWLKFINHPVEYINLHLSRGTDTFAGTFYIALGIMYPHLNYSLMICRISQSEWSQGNSLTDWL